jgi:hypothetical protein
MKAAIGHTRSPVILSKSKWNQSSLKMTDNLRWMNANWCLPLTFGGLHYWIEGGNNQNPVWPPRVWPTAVSNLLFSSFTLLAKRLWRKYNRTRGGQTGYQIDPDRLLNRTMFSFRTNHHRVYQKKSKFRKVFIHWNINKIQNVSLAWRKDLIDKIVEIF